VGTPALLLVASLAVQGCTSGDYAVPAAAPSEASQLATWCGTRGAQVRCLTDVGGTSIVMIPSAGESRGLVLWDPGGPGLGLPDADMPLDLQQDLLGTSAGLEEQRP